MMNRMNKSFPLVKRITKLYFRGGVILEAQDFFESVPHGGFIFYQKLQEVILNETIFNRERIQPNKNYRRYFAKKILGVFESQIQNDGAEDAEIDERLYKFVAFSDLDPEVDFLKSSEYTYMFNDFSIQIEEVRNLIGGNATTGHRTWNGSVALAEFFNENTQIIENCKVIFELGTGTALVSFSIAKTLPNSKIIATDGSSEVCNLLSISKNKNKIYNVQVQQYQWGNPVNESVDLILGSDIIYDPSEFPNLLRTIQLLLSQNPRARIFLATEVRNVDTYKQFLNACSERDIKWVQICFHLTYEKMIYNNVGNIRILELINKSS